jgi:hypothetical protein
LYAARVLALSSFALIVSGCAGEVGLPADLPEASWRVASRAERQPFARDPDGGPQPTAEPGLLHFGRLTLRPIGETLAFSFDVGNDRIISIPAVGVMRWYDGIDDTGFYDPRADIAVSWADDAGRMGLWVHAGGDTAFTALRNALELGPYGFFRGPQQIGGMMAGLRNRTVVVTSDGVDQAALVTSAIRVEPVEVAAMEEHIGDLLPYLGELYVLPEFLAGPGPGEGMILYFCGRNLPLEEKVEGVPVYLQARFVIVLKAVE